MCLDGHRSNDDAPYLFASEDYGQTWRSLNANLPRETTKVLVEDIVNPDVLYCGTEFGCYVTVNRGKDWTRLNSNLPTVAVHHLAQHPKNGDIVAATHGRSLWVVDATTIRQMKPETLAASSHLYKPNTAYAWRSEPSRGVSGARNFVGQNPPAAAQLYYSLGSTATDVSLKIQTLDGQQVRDLRVTDKGAGLHRVSWDLRRDPPQSGRAVPPAQRPETPEPRGAQATESATDPAAAEPGSSQPGRRGGGGPGTQGPPTEFAGGGSGGGGFAGGGGFGGGRGGGRFGRVEPGTYVVVLTVDGQESRQHVTIASDPDFPEFIAEEDEEDAGNDEENVLAPIVR